MEQRYNISGTHETLQSILQKEFNLSEEEARIATTVLVLEQNQEQYKSQVEEDTLWFLCNTEERYQAHIFSTRYTISFTNTILDIVKGISGEAVYAACANEDFQTIRQVLGAIKAVIKNVRWIQDDECCVYYQILRYLKRNPGPWISVKAAMPEIGSDKSCVHLDKKWKCGSRCGDSCEQCSMTPAKVQAVLDTFCKDGVMKPNADRSLYRFTI